MALPKRRHSSARRDKRRANWKLGNPPASRCSHCGATKRPHHICAECGYYRGEEVQVVNG